MPRHGVLDSRSCPDQEDAAYTVEEDHETHEESFIVVQPCGSEHSRYRRDKAVFPYFVKYENKKSKRDETGNPSALFPADPLPAEAFKKRPPVFEGCCVGEDLGNLSRMPCKSIGMKGREVRLFLSHRGTIGPKEQKRIQ
jgi:hypothetical protein